MGNDRLNEDQEQNTDDAVVGKAEENEEFEDADDFDDEDQEEEAGEE
jgi:hypothetical protein